MSSLVQEEYAKERRTRRMEDFQNSSSIDISENEILKYGDFSTEILRLSPTPSRIGPVDNGIRIRKLTRSFP